MKEATVNLYYAEVCDCIPGVLSDPERLTREYRVLSNVRESIATAYVQSFDHFRARWRVEHCTLQERVEQTLQKGGVGTGYDPRELDELLALYRQLPAEHRQAVRRALLEVQP